MQRKQATGIDTRMLLPVHTGLFCVISYFGLPVFSAPELRYEGVLETCKLITIHPFVDNLSKFFLDSGKLLENGVSMVFLALAGVLTCVFVALTVAIFRKKKQRSFLMTLFYGGNLLFAAALVFLSMHMNVTLQGEQWVDHPFLNLTISAKIRPTSFVYANVLLSLLMLLGRKRLVFGAEKEELYVEQRQWREDRTVGKRTRVSLFILTIGLPLVIFFGMFFLNDRSNLFIGLCIIGLASLPFLMVFEDRKPQARELILIAVLSAIAVVGRMAFFMLPQFKPMAAVIIIAGIGLGAEAGFLTGVVSGFVSNFFFGQGPWTPWQMFALGIIGFLAGLLFYQKKIAFPKVFQCLYGGVATFVIYGFLMDTASVLNVMQGWSKEAFLASYISGIPFNFVHAFSTVLFLAILAEPMERKLNRVKQKYGILQC